MATQPTFQFSNAAYQINQNERNASIVVTRTGDSAGDATVEYAVKTVLRMMVLSVFWEPERSISQLARPNKLSRFRSLHAC
jgi:hypothetical protein